MLDATPNAVSHDDIEAIARQAGIDPDTITRLIIITTAPPEGMALVLHVLPTTAPMHTVTPAPDRYIPEDEAPPHPDPHPTHHVDTWTMDDQWPDYLDPSD